MAELICVPSSIASADLADFMVRERATGRTGWPKPFRSLATAPWGEARFASGSATARSYTTTWDTTQLLARDVGAVIQPPQGKEHIKGWNRRFCPDQPAQVWAVFNGAGVRGPG